MAATSFDGPLIVSGNLANIPSATLVSNAGVPDPNQDASPSLVYQGIGIIDPRYIFPKDKVTGYTGVVPSYILYNTLKSIGTIPVALGAALIAAAANVVSGTAMTLAAANALGITTNVPIRPLSSLPTALNGNSVVTAPIALDFGFAFGNVTSGSKTVVVANSANFTVGMPLVIGGVGNSGGTVPLLTNCTGLTDATHITIADSPSASLSTAPIGTGDLWGPSEIGFPTPQAAFPFQAHGPGLYLDTKQSLARGVSITGVSGGAGGSFTITGWDIYGEPMTDTITATSGATTTYGLKAFKYIKQVMPNFSDAHNYSIGTADLFGFAFLSDRWEETQVFWAGAQQTSSTGWVTADTTSPATATTGDVRGTIQTGAAGPGSGIGSTASNGTLSSLALTGNRLEMRQLVGLTPMTTATQANPAPLFGSQQF